MCRFIPWSASLVLILASVLSAQEPGQGPNSAGKQASATRISDDEVSLDGRLDEEAWLRAQPVTDFVQKEPTEGAAPTERMEVRFLYNESALYVGARMFSNDPATIQAPMGRRDRGEQAEHILISIDSFLDRRTAQGFGVTASGVRLDRFYPADDEGNYSEDFDPVWEAKTAIDKTGWTAELWIPFSQLRFNERDEHVWGLNIQRFTPTLNEEDYWVLVPRTQRGWASHFGELRGIERLRGTKRIELLPYLASTSIVNTAPAAGNPFQSRQELSTQVGVDLKMGLGPSLTLDVTVNPDFGQVEADPAEVNLTAYQTRFSEKRPFFTEGSQLLTIAHQNVFYSRRIGTRPGGPATGDYVDYPSASTILAAAKVTGRLNSGTSIGMLSAVTDEEFARISTIGSPAFAKVRVATRTLYGLARVQQQFGPSASTASVIVAGSHRDLGEGDPLASLLPRNTMLVGGDALLRFKGGEYEATFAGVTSFVSGEMSAIERVQRSSAHYMQRPDQDYATLDPDRTMLRGYSTIMNIRRVGGRHWIWSANAKIDSPGFESNDIANLTAADSITPTFDVQYRETRPGRRFRNYSIGVNQSDEWNYGGTRSRTSLRPYTNLTWRNFWTTSFSFTRDLRATDPQLTRGGPLMGMPANWSSSVSLRNSAAARTRWSGRLALGGNEDGGLTRSLSGDFSFRPGPRWELSVAPSFERQLDTQQYVTSVAGGRSATFGRRYIFAHIDRYTYSSQFRMNFTLRPDVNLDVYAEPFASSGRYSRHGELSQPGSRELVTYGASGTTVAFEPDGSRVVTAEGAAFRLRNADFNVRSFRSNLVLRWEWRPGSTLYVVWQQDRQGTDPIGSPVRISDMFRSLSAPGPNYFVVKTSFWLPVT